MIMKTKAQIENDLRNNPNDERYEFYKHEKGKSDVWLNFELIKFEGIVQDFARCIKCGGILTYVSKSGTASLLRHRCPHLGKIKITDQASAEKLSAKFVATKQLIIKKQIQFIARDLRPLSITDGEGFLHFAQELVNLGADYGRISVREFLASRRTLTTTILPEEYSCVKSKLRCILKNNEVSFATDLWTDENTHRSFLTLSAYLINDSMELRKYVLGTRELFGDKKNGKSLRHFTADILGEYVDDAEDKLAKGVIVTDNGLNLVSAFHSHKRLSSACHNLKLIIQDVLESNDTLPDLKQLINESKKLVAYFKYSGLDSNLSKPLKQYDLTRCNSIYIMLNSVQDVYAEIYNILIAKDEIYRLDNLDLTLLKYVTDFLDVFQKCCENLSYTDKQPTLNQYVLWEQKLINQCNLKPEDSDLVRELKKQTITAMQKRYQPEDLHYLALFLDPNFKSLKFLSEDKQRNIMTTVRTMLQQSILEEAFKNLEKTPSKRPKLYCISAPASIFDEFQDSREEKIDSDITNYLGKNIEMNTSVLEFWKTCIDLPLLRKLARRILNIPASSAQSERLISTAGRLLSDELDQLLFLHTNCDL